jgi:predicted nucleic acid-binding protein
VRYLLDVNALIAYGFRRHGFYDRTGAWIRSRQGDRFLTCSITELGFVRVLGNVRGYSMNGASDSVEDAGESQIAEAEPGNTQ